MVCKGEEMVSLQETSQKNNIWIQTKRNGHAEHIMLLDVHVFQPMKSEAQAWSLLY